MLAIPIIYNLRNLWVRKVSTLLTVGGIALAVGVILVVMMLQDGLKHALVASGSTENAIVLRKGTTSETLSGIGRDSVQVIETAPEIAVDANGMRLVAAEVAVGVNLLRRGQTNARSGSNVTVRGITPASLALRDQVKIIEGRAITPGSAEILAGKNAARGFQGAEIGGTIPMGGLDWKVVGTFEAGGSSFESELWGDRDLLMEAFGRQSGFSSVTLRLTDPRLDVAAMDQRFDEDPRLNVHVQTEREYYETSSSGLSMLIGILGGVLAVLFSLGAILGAMVTMFAFVSSRTREIGTLRALGFPRRSIMMSFLIEALLLSLIGGIVAVIPALFVQQMTFSTTNFATFTDITWQFRATPVTVIIGLICSVILGVIGGLIPAIRAAFMPIISSLREA